MSTKFVMLDTVRKVEERIVQRWVSGTGKEAKFAQDSEGWYAVLGAGPGSIYLGTTEPGLKAGDRVRLTLERV